MRFPEENVLVINNTVKNMGIMKAHNLGVQFMNANKADWLIIVSAAIRFGEAGGLDFVQVLEEHMDYRVIHAASDNVAGGKQQTEDGGGVNEVLGWHLTAFRSTLFDNIGVWDENFTPYGSDDIDLALRIRKFYGTDGTGWDTFPIDVHDAGVMAHSINLAGVKSLFHPRNDYFIRKWGRGTNDWQSEGYEHPFNDPTLPLHYWPAPEDPRSIFNNEFSEGGSYVREEGWE